MVWVNRFLSFSLSFWLCFCVVVLFFPEFLGTRFRGALCERLATAERKFDASIGFGVSS